jgi:hypothetical protein
MKKRILMLLSVVALMVVMLASSVAPAFAIAREKEWNCFNRNLIPPEQTVFTKKDAKDLEALGYVCERPPKPKPV